MFARYALSTHLAMGCPSKGIPYSRRGIPALALRDTTPSAPKSIPEILAIVGKRSFTITFTDTEEERIKFAMLLAKAIEIVDGVSPYVSYEAKANYLIFKRCCVVDDSIVMSDD